MASNELVKIGALPLGSLIGALLVALAATVFWAQGEVNRHHRQALISEKADEIRYRIDLQQAELIKQLNGIAGSEQLIEIVQSDDPLAKSMEEERLRSVIADAIEVRLFGPGEAEVDRNASPPFTYTSLDLVNRAEAGLEVYPEAVNPGDHWILSIATPLSPPGDDGVYGTLFVYLDMNALSDGLTDELEGELRLSQTFANAPSYEILSAGHGATPNAAPVVRDLINPNWQVEFFPASRITSATAGDPLHFTMPLVIFFVLALAGTFAGLLRIRRAIDSDATRLSHQITDAINKDFNPSTDYQFAAFVDIDANLARVGKKGEQPREPVEPLKTATPRAQPKREEMVDIEMIDEETYEEELRKSRPSEAAGKEEASSAADVAAIFRAYDIRGIVNDTLTTEVIRKVGLAIGSEAGARGEQTVLVGADGRVSSPAVTETLIEGIRTSGRDVISLGAVPTPLLYFATQNTDATSGVMVTGSHNPPEYNGFKVVMAGRTFVERDIRQLYERFVNEDFSSGAGGLSRLDINDEYIDAVCDDVVVARSLKIIVDCGNGIAGSVAPGLYANLGCEVIPLYCEVDGNFPNHHPDPTIPENLDDLVLMMKSQKADLGIALDGDGDRLVAVSRSGEIVWPDQLLMLFAKDVVSQNPGSDVVYDVKCTRHINGVISGYGGRPIVCRAGHSFVKEKMAETNAVLGGELSGHICFAERWNGFDDGLYAGARLLEVVGAAAEGLDELLGEFPTAISTPEIRIPVDESRKFEVVRKLIASGDFPDGTVSTTDGLRVDFSEGWGLVRASNTTPALTLRFEADNDAGLQKIKQIFRERLHSVDSSLDF